MTHRTGTTVRHRIQVVALAMVGIASFAMPAAAVAADAPGACSTSAAARTKNAWLTGTIGSATDVDWYRFTVSTGTRAIVTLGNLPANYELRVYSGCSTLVRSSNCPGRQFEDVYAYLAAGSYFARVSGVAGASSTSTYALRFRTVAWGLPILSSTTWTDSSGYLHIAGEVLNNTAESRRWVQVNASLLNADGATIGSAVGYTDIPTLAPWTRSPFEIVTRKPSGYARTTLRNLHPEWNQRLCLGPGDVGTRRRIDGCRDAELPRRRRAPALHGQRPQRQPVDCPPGPGPRDGLRRLRQHRRPRGRHSGQRQPPRRGKRRLRDGRQRQRIAKSLRDGGVGQVDRLQQRPPIHRAAGEPGAAARAWQRQRPGRAHLRHGRPDDARRPDPQPPGRESGLRDDLPHRSDQPHEPRARPPWRWSRPTRSCSSSGTTR